MLVEARASRGLLVQGAADELLVEDQAGGELLLGQRVGPTVSYWWRPRSAMSYYWRARLTTSCGWHNVGRWRARVSGQRSMFISKQVATRRTTCLCLVASALAPDLLGICDMRVCRPTGHGWLMYGLQMCSNVAECLNQNSQKVGFQFGHITTLLRSPSISCKANSFTLLLKKVL